jgi:hypothetical protein
MLPFALAMLTLPYVGRRLGRYFSSSQVLVLGLVVAAVGDALTGWGADLGVGPVVMIGMVVLGSGGGLLNGETQKAITPEQEAGTNEVRGEAGLRRTSSRRPVACSLR